MVGMSVATVGGVGDDHRRAIAIDQRGEARAGLFERDVAERVGSSVAVPSVHAGIAVAEQFAVVHPEDGARFVELGQPHPGHLGVVVARLHRA